MTEETLSARDTLKAAIDALGITMTAEFVPWSRSRKKDEKDHIQNPLRSLNWKVTLVRNGRAIITTDYTAGSGHCPADKFEFPAGMARGSRAYAKRRMIESETEHGKNARYLGGGTDVVISGSKPILPDLCDVVYSLVSDASVLDSPTYEEWARECGYDEDSRKGEAIYRACLETTLKLRAGIGEDGLRALATASQDY